MHRDAVTGVAEDQAPLSERELEVLALVASGLSNQEIARRLVISINTVKVHVRSIFEKMGVQSRTEATLAAIRLGLVAVPGAEALPLPAAAAAAPAQVAGDDAPGVLPLPPVAGWQRLFAVAALLAALLLVVLPSWQAERRQIDTGNPVSDHAGVGAPSALAPVTRWTEHAEMPTARTRLALVAHSGQLYAIGGDRNTGVTGLVEAYVPVTDSWSPRAPKPAPASNVGAVAIGDRIYVPGGCTGAGTALDRLEVYDAEADAWAQAAPMPLAVCGYALAAVDRRMVVFGGWDGRAFVDRVQVYDLATDAWSELAPLPTPRGFAAAAAIGEVIYVVGGYDGRRELADTLACDPDTGRCTARSPMTSGRAGLGLAAAGGELYAIGGGWLNYMATSERYNPATDVWTVFETPTLGQWRNLGVAALDTEVYAVGGWDGDTMRVNRSYRALFRIVLPMVVQ
jgi:DNA-binding CsgD family transcriptional regulator